MVNLAVMKGIYCAQHKVKDCTVGQIAGQVCKEMVGEEAYALAASATSQVMATGKIIGKTCADITKATVETGGKVCSMTASAAYEVAATPFYIAYKILSVAGDVLSSCYEMQRNAYENRNSDLFSSAMHYSGPFNGWGPQLWGGKMEFSDYFFSDSSPLDFVISDFFNNR